MANIFTSLSRFYNNHVKSNPAFQGIRFLGQATNPKTWYGPLDQWLGTDFSGDKAAARQEEQRRYELGLQREDNAYQRAYADMRAAGMNPNIHGLQAAASTAAGSGDPMVGRTDSRLGNLGNLMSFALGTAGAVTNAKQAKASMLTAQSQDNRNAHLNLTDSIRVGLESKESELRQQAQRLENELLTHDRDAVKNSWHPSSTYKHGQQKMDAFTTGVGNLLDGVLSGKGVVASAKDAATDLVRAMKSGQADFSTIKDLYKVYRDHIQDKKEREKLDAYFNELFYRRYGR